MSLSNKSNSESRLPAFKVEKKENVLSPEVVARKELTREITKTPEVKSPAKKELKELSAEVKENKEQTLKTAVVRKFNDSKEADQLLNDNSSAAAFKLMEEIDARFKKGLDRMPSDGGPQTV